MRQVGQQYKQPDSNGLTRKYYNKGHMKTTRGNRRVWGTAEQRSMVIRRDGEHARLHYRSDLALCEFLG